MDRFFAQFSAAQRSGLGLALCGFAVLTAWLSLRLAVGGPWHFAFLTMLVAALAVTIGLEAWPSKLPPEIQVLKEKWDKAKSRSTKSIQGRFVWRLGRSAIAAMLVFHALPVEISGGFIAAAVTIGAGVALGFFGVRAAMWSGVTIYLVGHRAALAGLNVDFSQPESREALWILWSQGSSMSWWWAIGLGLCPLLWIGSSGLMVKVGNQLSEEMAERRAAAIAKAKIEARRQRLRSKRDEESSDPIAAANKETEAAKKRAASVAGKDVGYDNLSVEKETGSEELRGVAKLEYEKNEILLRKYAGYVKEITASQARGIDFNTANRRGFDRVVAGLSHASLDHLRAAQWEGATELLDYYNRLCGIEEETTSGGDGEIVSDHGGAGGRASEPVLPMRGHSVDEESEDDVDVMDHPPAAEPVKFSRRAAAGGDTLDMILAAANARTPVNVLESGEAEEDHMDDAAGFADNSAAHSLSDVDEEGDVMDAAVESAKAGALAIATPALDQKSTVADPVTNEEASAADRDGQSEELDVIDGTSAGDTDASDDAMAGEGVSVPAESSDPVVTVDVEYLRLAAGRIIVGKTDREFVLETLGQFDEVKALSDVVTMSEDLLADPFAQYQILATAARTELALAAALDAESPDVDAVRSGLDEVRSNAANWAADDVLLRRAESWLTQRDAEIALERAQEEEREAQRQAEEEARARQEEADREAERRRQEEAAERAAEEARIAAEQAEAEREERAAREAEEARLAALAENKGQYANRILVGAFSDEVLEAGVDLFPSIEAFAEATSLPQELVEGRFDEFLKKCRSKAKYDELREAMADEDNLERVKALIAEPELFGDYHDPSLSIADAEKWIDGIEVKHRVVGLKDGVVHGARPISMDTQKAFMKKRYGTSDDLIEIIEHKLPEALSLAKQIDGVLAMLPSPDPSMVSHRDRALGVASDLAAALVAEENSAKEYATSFLPKAVHDVHLSVWDMIVELASKASGTAKVASPAMDNLGDPNAEIAKAGTGALLKPISFSSGIKTAEEIQKIDPMTEFASMEFHPLKQLSDYERLLAFSYKGMFAGEPKTKSDPLNTTFSLYLGEEYGRGRVLFFLNLSFTPLWYWGQNDCVYSRDMAEKKIMQIPGHEVKAKIERNLVNHAGKDEQVKGIVILSPYLTADGEKSFEPFLSKFQGCPIIIQNIERLNSSVFRAFVDRIQGS
jgi:hypothetical protein